MADRANITPSLLKWARETAKMSTETAAAKVSVSVSKLEQWENGTLQPTIKQAQKLAKAYKRPFALLFLAEIPRDFQPLQDFRRKGTLELTTASVFIIREIQQKQSWISDVYAEDSAEKLPFVGRFSKNSDPRVVAEDILRTLDIVPPDYKSRNPLKEWIDAAERKGIFVSRTSFIHSKLRLNADELQGFAIADPYAPFVFVNSDDWDKPQLFTLVHELAHLWIAESGISSEIGPEMSNKDKFHPVEVFCNVVAAHALMPEQHFRETDQPRIENAKQVFKMASSFGVSSFAFLVRALHLSMISPAQYQKLKKEADKEYKEFLQREEEKRAKLKLRQKEKQGGPSPYLLRVHKNSKLFTQVVLDAFKGGLVEPTQASFLLNTPVNNFHRLEAQLHK